MLCIWTILRFAKLCIKIQINNQSHKICQKAGKRSLIQWYKKDTSKRKKISKITFTNLISINKISKSYKNTKNLKNHIKSQMPHIVILSMKNLLKLIISKRKPKVKLNTWFKETDSDIRVKLRKRTSKKALNSMNTVRMKWTKMSKKKSKIQIKNRNSKIKVKTESKKVWKYTLKINKNHKKNTRVQPKLNINMIGTFQVQISVFMTAKINLNRPAEKRARLITTTKVSPPKKSILMTISRVSHNFPNFLWAVATPEGKLVKFPEDDRIDLKLLRSNLIFFFSFLKF